MASRAQQKEQARQQRLAQERERAERARRQRRLQMIVGVVVAAVVVVGIAIAISVGSGSNKKAPAATSAKARQIAATVASALNGIPQNGNRLGSPSAKVTVTEYGDLQCPICAQFAQGAEKQLIAGEVRSGKVALVYRSLCTATCNYNQSLFVPQQTAAIAAGLQNKEWNYVELFYNEQGAEGTPYVNDAFLNGLATQIPGLNYQAWSAARGRSSLAGQVTADEQAAATKGFNSTPTLLFSGPKGTQSVNGDVPYSTVQQAIKLVS